MTPTRVPALTPTLTPTRLRLLAALCGLLLAAPTVPGAAAEPAPSVSLTGARRAATIDRPLWDTDLRWVPGDERSVDVWLRNDSTTTAAYEVAVRADSSPRDRVLADALRVRVESDGDRHDLGAGAVRLPALDPGDQRRLRFTAALPASATNATQDRRVAVTLQLTPLAGPNRKGGR